MNCTDIIKETIRVFETCLARASSSSDRSLLQRHILALNQIMESLDQHGSMKYQISSFEKLLSDPWMDDRNMFETVYYAWENFKIAYQAFIGGMTVNERLHYTGLTAEFEKKKNKLESRTILREVFISDDDIEKILSSDSAVNS
ncbi:MAG: hypothetical protein IPJ88_15385 [Myxococcales bacterium]|nr:MAG: hypothetical protein IPJ88_15385 [Myxococcales bacterium]